jgi:CelD/BcsL family acetyltransferase involved in cellulose biosynthesis
MPDGRRVSGDFIDLRHDQYWPLIVKHRFGSLFTSPPWIEAVAQAFDFQILASAQTAGSKLEAAVPFCHVSDFRGDRVVCLPFSDYCDPLVEDAASWAGLIEPILSLGMPVTLRCLRNRVPVADDRFRLVGRGLWHGIDLTRSEDELWAGLAPSARQNIRKARRKGVVVVHGRTVEDLRVFHHMHCQLRKSKYRLLAQPLAFFESLYASFAPYDRLTVLLALADDTPIAGTLFLEWGDTLYYKFNASLDRRLRPNDLLVWEGIRLGRQRRLARLDFGLSDPAQLGLVRYKRKFATEEGEISFLRWQPPDHSDPNGELAGETLHRMTHLMTDPSVPDHITRACGDALYRFFC